jgi:tetratricopeptide (TPR) repeat protein
MMVCGEPMKTIRRTAMCFLAVAGLALGPRAVAQQAPTPQTPTASAVPALSPQLDMAKRAEAYFNFSMGHLSEQQYDATGRPEFASRAIDYYKKALTLDPGATTIIERLAETYAKSQRIRDAVLEAQNVLKTDPDNLGAHRLLARIYVRTLGDLDSTPNQKNTIRLAVEQLKEIARLDPGDTESALLLARLYGFENQHDKAEEVLRKVLSADSDNEAVLEQLSQLLIEEGRAADAIVLLEQAESRSPSAGVEDLLGDAYLQAREYAKAEKSYRAAVEEEPDDVTHRRGLAQSLYAQDKYAAALEQFKKVSELDPDSPEAYLRLSEIYRRLNQYDLAEAALVRAKQHAPGSLEVLDNEALLYEAQKRYDDAIHVLSDAIAGVKSQSGEPGPNALAVLYEQLGRVYREKEDYAAAVRTFEELEKLGPENQRRGQMLVIDTYRASRDLDRAIAAARKAMQLDPKDPDLLSTYAMLLGEKGQTEEAAKVLQGMLHGNAGDRDVYLNLAQVEERGRRYPDAEQAAQKAEQLSREPDDKQMAWFLLGAIYERQKKYDEAEVQFRKVLQVNPRNAPVLNYYGYMLADRGVRLEEATSLIKRALAEESTNGAYLDSLGWAYFKRNRLAEAEEYLRKAAESTTHDPTILDHLGDVEAKLGRSEQAAELWEKALSEWQKSSPADYEPEQVNNLDKKLKNLKHRLAQKSAAGETKPQ